MRPELSEKMPTRRLSPEQCNRCICCREYEHNQQTPSPRGNQSLKKRTSYEGQTSDDWIPQVESLRYRQRDYAEDKYLCHSVHVLTGFFIDLLQHGLVTMRHAYRYTICLKAPVVFGRIVDSFHCHIRQLSYSNPSR